jgi:pantoate--beta-alanine ligase
MTAAADLAQTGTSVAAIRALIEAIIASEPRASLKGLDTVTPDTLEPVEGPLTQPLAVMLSVQFSDILLIDQKVIQP